MRFRSTDSRSGAGTFTVTDIPGGTTNPPCNGWKGEYKSIEDIVTPDFASKMRSGAIVMNPFRLYRSWRPGTNVTAVFGPHPTWGSRTISGDICGHLETFLGVGDPLSTSEDEGRLKDQAVVQAFARMNSSDVMSGELAATFQETLKMLRRPFQGSVDLLAKMTKYRNRHLGKTIHSATKATANAWLEYRYGWRPLLGDAESIIDAVHSSRSAAFGGGRGLVARGGARMSREMVTTHTFAPGTVPSMGEAQCSVRWQKTLTANAGVWYELKPRTSSDDLAAKLGLRVRDIPATIWELVPWSFVADWFINVGDWIEAVTPNPDVTVKGSWVTSKIQAVNTLHNAIGSIYVSTSPATTYTANLGTSTWMSDTVVRDVGVQPTTLPTRKATSLSVNNIVDGLALAVGTISSQLRTFRH